MKSEDIKKKWEELIQKSKDSGIVDMGTLSVGLYHSEGSTSIIICDDLDMSFEMVLPEDLSDDAKESLILMAAMADPNLDVSDPAVFKELLVNSYKESLIPNINESLKGEVEKFPPISVIRVIMSYLDMLVSSMGEYQCNEAFIGPDGTIYVEDEVAYDPDQICESIMCNIMVNKEDAKMLMRWVVGVASEFAGVFPGTVAEKSGGSVSVKMYNNIVAQSFIISMNIINGDSIEEISYEEFPAMFKFDIGVMELLDESLNNVGEGYSSEQNNMIKSGLMRAIEGDGKEVPWEEIVAGMGERSEETKEIIINLIADAEGFLTSFVPSIKGLSFYGV